MNQNAAPSKPRRRTPPIEAHRKVYEFLERMPPEEGFQIAVEAGIYTPEG